MTAVRERIFAEIDARLREIPDVREYQRMPSGDPTKFNALHVFDNGDRPEVAETGTSSWMLGIGIDGYVSGGTGSQAHGEANALYCAVVEALFTEPVIGGLATEITIDSLNFAVAERASARRMAFSLDLTIHYATRRGEPQTIG